MGPIETRLAKSMMIGAMYGTQEERFVFERQAKEACREITTLRAEIATQAERIMVLEHHRARLLVAAEQAVSSVFDDGIRNNPDIVCLMVEAKSIRAALSPPPTAERED